jgi:hypothetical protein
MESGDEFAEFDMDEATFDAILERAEPVELIDPPRALTLAPGGIRFELSGNAAKLPPDTAVHLESFGLANAG